MTNKEGTHRYTYDNLYRLTEVIYPNGSKTTYTYDPVGNRLTMNDITYTYNEADQLLKAGNTTYSYDNDGNLIEKIDSSGTTTYTYDFENRLVEITFPDGGTNTFGYCPFGKRVWKKNKSGTTTFYFYDTADILAEYDTFGNLKARYTFGRGIDNPISVRIGTQSYFYHFDALGSVISLTDSNKTQVASYSYDAFGKPSTMDYGPSTMDNPFLFTSREYEPESGLYFYRARYYDPEIGRFISTDPILRPSTCPRCPTGATFPMKGAGLLSYRGVINRIIQAPWRLHFYVYVQNNPINLIDPRGLWEMIGDEASEWYKECYWDCRYEHQCDEPLKSIIKIYCAVACALFGNRDYSTIQPGEGGPGIPVKPKK